MLKKKHHLTEHQISILANSVEIDPKVRSGVPVLKGTRIPITLLLTEIEEEGSLTEVANDRDLDVTLLKNLLNDITKLFYCPTTDG